MAGAQGRAYAQALRLLIRPNDRSPCIRPRSSSSVEWQRTGPLLPNAAAYRRMRARTKNRRRSVITSPRSGPSAVHCNDGRTDGGKRFSDPLFVFRPERYRSMLRFGDFGRKISRWCGTYCRYGAQCAALARKTESPEDRAVLLQITLMWVRPAEHAAKLADLYPEGNRRMNNEAPCAQWRARSERGYSVSAIGATRHAGDREKGTSRRPSLTPRLKFNTILAVGWRCRSARQLIRFGRPWRRAGRAPDRTPGGWT